MDKGFIKLSRKFFENDIWLAARKFNDSEAWLDLIQSARFDASEITLLVGGREITWNRGQYPASIRYLAKKWQWGERRVRTFLDKLKRYGMISTDDSQGMTIITLSNYDRYNSHEAPGDTQKDTPKDTDNNLNNKSLMLLVTQAVTQAMTQVATQQAEKGHSDDTNKKKDNNISLGESYDSPCGTSQPHVENIDYPKLVEYFNTSTKGVFGIVRLPLSDTRKGMINARIRQYGKKTFMDMVRLATRSSYLTGQNNRNWHATFDWLIKPNNFEKVISLNYEDNSNTAGSADAINSEDFMRNIAEGISRGTYEREKRDVG